MSHCERNGGNGLYETGHTRKPGVETGDRRLCCITQRSARVWGDSLAERGRPGEAVLFLFIFRDAEVDMGERGEARCPPEFLEEELLGPVDLERPMGGFSIRALTEDPVSHQTIRDS